MRVGLFGISRSGKNYTISDFLKIAEQNGCHFVHMSPIDMVRERLNGRKLRDIPLEEKKQLVNEVRAEVDTMAKKENVIVDEHYCFPADFGGKKVENGYHDEKLPFDILHIDECMTDYEVVLPRFELRKYDLVVFMDIDSSIILDRFRTSEGCKQNLIITKEQIDEWKEIERSGVYSGGEEFGTDRWWVITDPNKSGKQLWDGVRYSMMLV